MGHIYSCVSEIAGFREKTTGNCRQTWYEDESVKFSFVRLWPFKMAAQCK